MLGGLGDHKRHSLTLERKAGLSCIWANLNCLGSFHILCYAYFAYDGLVLDRKGEGNRSFESSYD